MTYTYNPKNVIIQIDNDPNSVKGLAEDSFITITPKGEGTQSQTGCDGTVVRSIDVNKQVVVRLTLQQTSPTNDLLTEKYYADKQNATGAFRLTILEMRNGEEEPIITTGADGAWVVNYAELTRGRTAGNREWTIETEGVDFG